MSSSSNSWLRNQRKSSLSDLAEEVGLKNYESLKKVDLETALDEFLTENAARLSSKSELAGYYNSRSKALGSPVKKDSAAGAAAAVKEDADKVVKTVRRRATKAAEEVASEVDAARSAVQTPGRSLSQVAARIPLPATPADVANAVDRSTLAMRKRASSIYRESGITEVTHATRDSLSTVNAIILLVGAFELVYIRPEVLANRFAFTIPAVGLLGTPDYPVYLPDMFLLLTSSFWSPALTWVFTSFVLPAFFGYFFNLSATSPATGAPRTRARAAANPDYTVDPLTFSVAKALVSFLVYGQGVTFGGLLSDTSIERLASAVYGGYKGILTGTAITGLASFYDAVLRK
ncbi:hypothetical protein ACRE_032880 [Hapsidospora chrysogenum ATCC 11550]|uniref:Uncharacterized protein n=1 Tax=Hapsidospora chrysogenum (strain ATCC 11550 / CBS 779.69 / DSM 880 / IAM 14645 / JCM 23072 / IMI 49137) TaxID=857340 RepID=A0A086T8Y9_HAPC1|nr:hypothetical protein ACRE_032880 [Hapsidospora chrysogenum ATCC 11550]